MGADESSRRILVNLSLDSHSLEQLSWAITVASRPGDSVIALHLLHDSDSEIRGLEKQYERARAGVYSLVEQCRELCHFRQVTPVVRIVPVINPEQRLRILLDQASLLSASTLILGASDVAPHSKLSGFTVWGAAAPRSCLVFVAEDNEMRGNKTSNQVPENDESPTRAPLAQEPELVQIPFDLKGLPSDYSPRGVLDGPANAAAPSTSPEASSSGSSPSFNSKPLLLSSSSSGEQSKLQEGDPHPDDDGDEDEEVMQASCLSLFKHMKRHQTFPSTTSSSSRASRLFPSFSCGSAQSQGMRFSTDTSSILQSLSFGERLPWRCFTYEELLSSTNSFHSENFVGKGGYAVVYKGRLPDGQLIAVKKLISSKGESEQNKEGGFLTELGIIGHVSHGNTSSLIGFCVEHGLHLIFPFAPNGSLASVLHGPKVKSLAWGLRQKIAVGTARGLHYLHKVCPRRIIHRDIKASNILLGTDFEPQISDFGLAKWLPEQWTHHTVTPIEGTFGYLAPEYFMHGIVDEKTDVFAYGVLLLELITGRKPIDSKQGNLIVWARPYLESCNVQELVDPKLNGAYDVSQLRRLMLTAVLCVRQSPLWRPCMNQVVKLLTEDCVDEETNWSTIVCSSSDVDDEYMSKEYRTDLSRHRALALGTS